MLALFRTNQIIANVFLLLYALILRSAIFFNRPTPEIANPGIFSEWLYGWVAAGSLGGQLLALVLIVFHALLINITVANHRIANEVSLFPGLIYVLVSSCIPEFLYLSPLVLANTFYLLALISLYNTYRRPSAAGAIFNVGLWVGIGSLFYFSYIVLFLFAFISLGILRAFRIKERLMLFLGFASAYLLTSVYFFLNNQWQFFWSHQFNDNIGLLDFQIFTGWDIYIKLGIMAIFLVVVLFSFNQYIMKKNIQKQKFVKILYWGLLISAITLLFQKNIGPDHLLILALPISILLSFNFLSMRKPVAEAVHFLLFIGILILQYKFWWMIG